MTYWTFFEPDIEDWGGNPPYQRSRRVGMQSRLIVGLLVLICSMGNGFVAQGASGVEPRQGNEESQAPSPATPVAGAPSSVARAETGLISLNFTGADLVEVIHVLAQYLKLNYTIDPGVGGHVTLYSAEPLRQESLLPVFHQVLRMNGAVAVKSGDFYHIAAIKDGKGLVRVASRPGEQGYILQVVPVRFFSVEELKRLLEPFVTPGGEILAYPRGNFLMILDLASNIQRLLEIKDLIDINVFAGVRMEVYQPKAASAEELAAEMEKIMQAYAASVPQAENFVARFVPIPRINRMFVISYSEAAWTYAERWLARIDTYAEGPGRKIFVYPVENGNAVDLADILNRVLGQSPRGMAAPRKTLKDVAERIAGGQPPFLPGSPSRGATVGASGSSTESSGSLYAATPTPAQPSPAESRPAPSRSSAQTTPTAEEDPVRIVPDPATNSLIVFGTGQEFQNIRNILKEIDIVPRQVLMDVLIAEVTLSDDLKFGLEYEIGRRDEGVRIFDREFGQRASILTGLAGPATAGGPGPQALSAVIGTGDALRAFINARMEDSRVKVLSSPTILATDNQPARIQVGTEEPIPTGTVSSPVSGGTITSSTTVQFRNTGRILTIIPQVNAAGLVNLQIKAEVSQRGPNVTVGQDSFPSFDTRDAETTAVVQDGETLAIGGIITERVNRSRTGIPFLMDIPVLGRFFGTTTDDIDRAELIMLITPHVIRNKEEARSVTEEFKQRLLPVVEQFREEIANIEEFGKLDAENPAERRPLESSRAAARPSSDRAQADSGKAVIVLPANHRPRDKFSPDPKSFRPPPLSHDSRQGAKEIHSLATGNDRFSGVRKEIVAAYSPPVKHPPQVGSSAAPARKDPFTHELLAALLKEAEERTKKEHAADLDGR